MIIRLLLLLLVTMFSKNVLSQQNKVCVDTETGSKLVHVLNKARYLDSLAFDLKNENILLRNVIDGKNEVYSALNDIYQNELNNAMTLSKAYDECSKRMRLADERVSIYNERIKGLERQLELSDKQLRKNNNIKNASLGTNLIIVLCVVALAVSSSN